MQIVYGVGPACIQKLNLLTTVAKKVREALETNMAKQHAMAA